MDPQVMFDPEYCAMCGSLHQGFAIRCFLCHGYIGRNCCYALKDEPNITEFEHSAALHNFVFICDVCELDDDDELITTSEMHEILATDEFRINNIKESEYDSIRSEIIFSIH